MNRRIVAALRLLLERAESAVGNSIQASEDVTRRPLLVGETHREWRKGDDKVNMAERHAKAILAAVAEYRATQAELQAAEQAWTAAERNTEPAASSSPRGNP